MSDFITESVSGLPATAEEAYKLASQRLGSNDSTTIEADRRKFQIERSPADWFWGNDKISVYSMAENEKKLLLTFTRDNTFWTSYEAEKLGCEKNFTIGCSDTVLQESYDEETGELTDRDYTGGGLETGYDIEEAFIDFVPESLTLQAYRSDYISSCDRFDLMALRAMAATFGKPIIQKRTPYVSSIGED